MLAKIWLLALALVNPHSSLETGSQPIGRTQGLIIVIVLLMAFLVGAVLSGLFAALAASWAGYHGSLAGLSLLASPPWWLIMSTLIGLWFGYTGGTVLCQRLFHLFEVRKLFRVRWSDLSYLALGVAVQLLIGLAYLPFHLAHYSAPTTRLFGNASGGVFAVLCIMTAAIVPFFEELFFRVVLLRGLWGLAAVRSAKLSMVFVIGLDALIFAGAHAELVQLPGLAVVGAVLAYLYLRTGRLAPSYLTHASFNTLAVIVLIAQRTHG